MQRTVEMTSHAHQLLADHSAYKKRNIFEDEHDEGSTDALSRRRWRCRLEQLPERGRLIEKRWGGLSRFMPYRSRCSG